MLETNLQYQLHATLNLIYRKIFLARIRVGRVDTDVDDLQGNNHDNDCH